MPEEAAPEPSGKFAERAKRNHALVHGLRAEGRGIREIARHPGCGRHAVQRYERAATWQELVDGRWTASRPGKLGPFKPYLDRRADGTRGSATALFHAIRELGYDGGYSAVRDYLARHGPARTPLPAAPPTVRDVTNWLTRRPGTLTEDEGLRLKAILDRRPELRAASDQVRGFAEMMTGLTGRDLPQWMADATAAGLPGISSFAKGLEQDLDAVTNGLTMNWSSGPVEGRVNHIKTVKRQMFGRAGLPLLRKRVLLTAKR
jgi:transposase